MTPLADAQHGVDGNQAVLIAEAVEVLVETDQVIDPLAGVEIGVHLPVVLQPDLGQVLGGDGGAAVGGVSGLLRRDRLHPFGLCGRLAACCGNAHEHDYAPDHRTHQELLRRFWRRLNRRVSTPLRFDVHVVGQILADGLLESA